ncbi:MAG: hypothetical protein AABX99_01090 [Nanoarchaeota archaeon]
MAKNLQYKKDKRALSTIVVTLILIVLSLVAVGIVWGFISNIINKQISSSQSCFGNYDKIKLDGQYTCYEISGTNYDLRFSLYMGDVKVDKVIISVSSAGTSNSYAITNTAQNIVGLAPYPMGTSNSVILPVKNAGLTYKATGFTSKIDSIKIAAVIDGTQCDVSDTLTQIEDCVILA